MKKYNSVSNYRLSEPLKFELYKKYDEVLSLLILRMVFYPNYELFILSDAPDIIRNDGKIGIEVTRAVEEKDAATESAFIKINYCFDEERLDTWKEIIEKNGAVYDNGILFHESRDEQRFLEPFKEVVKKKIAKYGKYMKKGIEKIGLMIYFERPIISGHSKTWVKVYEEMTHDKKTYDFVFFLYYYGLDVYDSNNKTFKSYDIDQDDFQYLSIMATMIVTNKLSLDSEECKNIF